MDNIKSNAFFKNKKLFAFFVALMIMITMTLSVVTGIFASNSPKPEETILTTEENAEENNTQAELPENESSEIKQTQEVNSSEKTKETTADETQETDDKNQTITTEASADNLLDAASELEVIAQIDVANDDTLVFEEGNNFYLLSDSDNKKQYDSKTKINGSGSIKIQIQGNVAIGYLNGDTVTVGGGGILEFIKSENSANNEPSISVNDLIVTENTTVYLDDIDSEVAVKTNNLTVLSGSDFKVFTDENAGLISENITVKGNLQAYSGYNTAVQSTKELIVDAGSINISSSSGHALKGENIIIKNNSNAELNGYSSDESAIYVNKLLLDNNSEVIVMGENPVNAKGDIVINNSNLQINPSILYRTEGVLKGAGNLEVNSGTLTVNDNSWFNPNNNIGLIDIKGQITTSGNAKITENYISKLTIDENYSKPFEGYTLMSSFKNYEYSPNKGKVKKDSTKGIRSKESALRTTLTATRNNHVDGEKINLQAGGTHIITTGSVDIIAKYPAIHTVTFDTDGGNPDYVMDIKVLDGQTIRDFPVSPSKGEQYAKSWHTEKDGAGMQFTNDTLIRGNFTVYPFWSDWEDYTEDPTEKAIEFPVLKNFTLTFDYGDTKEEFKLKEGFFAPEPDEPQKEGYIFKGWYSDSGYSKQWDFENDKISKDTTLYPKWIEKYFEVTFNNGNDTKTINVQEGSLITKQSDPTKSGYTFTGWFSNPELTNKWNFENDKVFDKVSLYAGWQKIAEEKPTETTNTQRPSNPTVAPQQPNNRAAVTETSETPLETTQETNVAITPEASASQSSSGNTDLANNEQENVDMYNLDDNDTPLGRIYRKWNWLIWLITGVSILTVIIIGTRKRKVKN